MSDTPDERPPIVAAMTRASTLKQTASPATQREILGRACHSLNLGEPLFLDEPLGTSGRSLKFAQRPMGIWALRNLRKGDTLIVTEMRTIGRNFIDQYSTVQTLFDRGVHIIVLKGFGNNIIDLRKSTDRLFLAILSWVSDEEAERIAERTREAHRYRKEAGLSVGQKTFTYIQAYDADGDEIPCGDYNKLKGHFKKNVFDTKWLDQLCELLLVQRTMRVSGMFLYRYCQERDFRTTAGKQWWNGKVFFNINGKPFVNQIHDYLRQLRRMAVRGDLPEEYCTRVLALTGDTAINLLPIPRKRRGKREE